MKTVCTCFIGALMLSACAAGASEQGAVLTSGSSVESGMCQVTVPPRPGFVAPEPYPPEPPFGDVWYGTAKLWANLDPQGQVWSDLPGEKNGSVFNKTLWWSEDFSTARGEDFTGKADITVRAMQLDESTSPVVVEGGVPSFNRDVGNFMLVGLILPEAGCWEVTASYDGVELAYVLQVEP